MRKLISGLFLTTLTLASAGCATGFRAGGPNGGGVAVGAAVGQPPARYNQPVYYPPILPKETAEPGR
jgi:hypothetical protein